MDVRDRCPSCRTKILAGNDARACVDCRKTICQYCRKWWNRDIVCGYCYQQRMVDRDTDILPVIDIDDE